MLMTGGATFTGNSGKSYASGSTQEVDPGDVQGVTGVGNSDRYIGWTDSVHWSQSAIPYVAERDANAFRSLINSLPY